MPGYRHFLAFAGIFLSFYQMNGLAQNLVRNPGFDQFYNYTDENHNLVYHPEYWFYEASTSDHPIYFCAARFGNKTLAWNPHPDSTRIREGENLNYISILILPITQRAFTKLESPLRQGKLYRLSLDIRLTDQSNYLSDLLVGFKANGKMDTITTIVNLLVPDSLCNENAYKNWIKLSNDFTATGKEAVLAIAAGTPDDYRKIISSDPDKYQLKRYQGPPRLKYYVDNISLTSLENNLPDPITTLPDTLKSGKSLILENIYFDFNSYELLPASFPELDSLVGYLLSNPDLYLRISGHTDNFGSEAYNEVLSLKRAESVTEYLSKKGIDKDRLKAIGNGAKYPLDSNQTAAGRKRNRRIEIQLEN
jgi:outer membrane protein OmpA-like peptidoglycan-associated protein